MFKAGVLLIAAILVIYGLFTANTTLFLWGMTIVTIIAVLDLEG